MSGFRPRFFVDHDDRLPSLGEPPELGTELVLSVTDSKHALQVLRLRGGDECEVVVGVDAYMAEVARADDRVKVVLTARLEGPAAGANYRSRVGLVQSLSRAALFDEIVEKGTEVGASFFVFVQADGRTRAREASSGRRLERWRRIALEAAKQSRQLAVPTVEWMDSTAKALDSLEMRGAHSIALDPSAEATLHEKLGRSAHPGSTVALWIGPESGWSATQWEWLKAHGIETGRLGQGVLRAETAGPVAVAVTRLLMGDW